jgi:uncharacterized membrane protein
MATSVMNLATRQVTGRPAHSTGVNVGETERWASAVGGTLLALCGFTSRGISQVALPIVGGLLVYRGLSGYCPVYGTLNLNTADETGARTAVEAGHGVKVERAVTINKPADELYRFWRNFVQLPQFMSHLEEVRVIDKRSHWVAKAPLGMRVEWDAEVINDKPNELIAWRSLPGSDVDTAGSVHFAPAAQGRGTEVRVTLKYDPPAGKVGATLARWLGEAPETQIRADLLRFKQLMETGEIATVEGQPSGRAMARSGTR